MNMRGLLVAAPRSGSGKTTIALGLMRALRRRGFAVQPFKCGPDYIDPAWHKAAAGRDSLNLDSWAMRPALLRGLVGAAGPGADLAIVEGVMGLFDGVATAGQAGRGASADIAALTGWPVLLVLDVAGQTETAAAVALGCARYRTDVGVAGVILNRVASERHLALVAPPIEALGIPVFGAVFRDDRLALPERHLGLVQAVERDDLDVHLDRIADTVSARLDLEKIIAAARPGVITSDDADAASLPPPGQKVALARDAAFSFMYPHLIRAWRKAGAEIVPFSPLADEAPDHDADSVWLPGGYPELHAGKLASAARFNSGTLAAAERGAKIHGECGGFMMLGQGLVDADGTRHAMLGLLGLETSFARRKLHLGYRRAILKSDSVLGATGATLHGHEFHYATTLACPDEALADCFDATGAAVAESGARRGNVTGTFFHVIDRG
ncbi:cobyrinic acid a,c-diamide synthase [Rhodoplanes elegans]|uniref:Hydrogenobyrinate a,c-diamide synthase n=1 Tax=Rhodoplanes elegans TaxID=29408 RepID=A0A327KK66_9BRAD|nr:cobyrinate a,c-diamide synthase [Rhodoplanes elegans]MBK5959990.1 cobyrinic acid a,c-diamide synthase [Rhodoplanes elegans]RAI38486.1 cobyrinic acid a,c-diamide synthase [Rhodoplanes elegans]